MKGVFPGDYYVQKEERMDVSKKINSQEPTKQNHCLKQFLCVVCCITSGIFWGFYLLFCWTGLVKKALIFLSIHMIFTFFASLFLFHLLRSSESRAAYKISQEDLTDSSMKYFDQKEVRRAITITFLLFYFDLLPISTKIVIAEKSLASKLYAHFDIVILTVVGFYFGARALEAAADTWKKVTITRTCMRMNAMQNFSDKRIITRNENK